MIELLQKWAELEPERCRIGGDTTQNGLSYFSVCGKRFPGNGRVTQDGEWLLCGMIEAAIVEREGWWFISESPQETGDGPGDWRVRIFINGQDDEWYVDYAPTKLPALLSAYVQALEKLKNSKRWLKKSTP
ncbi:MAG: hypothetical protein K1Y36_06825 [Blastocatellia bacterium]|nr:hypothetical protein [Blastocatellia bacterium]